MTRAVDVAQCAPELAEVLNAHPDLAIAVSGGVDSLTLATFAGRLPGRPVQQVFHAVSPAVPAEATALVERQAETEGWRLARLDAGEFSDPDYLRNPVNRCYFCKSNLYDRIFRQVDRPIAAGTNTDDLGEYRPGLDAAARYGVVHPYVAAGIDKAGVRAIARMLGLGEIAELPATPCLASRIETGIRVEAGLLVAVHDVETLVRRQLDAATVRCRIRAGSIVVELEPSAYDSVSDELHRSVHAVLARHGLSDPLSFAIYRRGSAFVGHD